LLGFLTGLGKVGGGTDFLGKVGGGNFFRMGAPSLSGIGARVGGGVWSAGVGRPLKWTEEGS